MIKNFVITLAIALMTLTSVAFGAVKEGHFTVTPLIGGYFYDDKQNLDPSLVLGLRGGYNFTKAIGIEALYDYVTRTDASAGSLTNISANRYGGQVLYHFFPEQVLVPYLAAGYSVVILSGSGVSSKDHGAFDYGAGVKYFLKDDIAVRGDVRHILYRYDANSIVNLEFSLGATFQFGGVTPVVKAVEPAVVAPTPAPEPVKIVAAPVPEPIKAEAPPTPEPAPVVPVVVPMPVPPVDSDGDGVIDTLDKCPGTPAGVAADINGCPVDSDKDVVPDYLDKCPGTPAGVNVDSNGCPVDSDKDGVPDHVDKCQGTPFGITVDVNGCPLETAKKLCDKPTVIAIVFEANKSDISAKYFVELDKLGLFLKDFTASKGIIEGHTDSDGSKEANLKLSQARAESVRNYIINKFAIADNRIIAKGFGSAKPVSSNKSAVGKAKNRRIEAVFTCE